MGKWMDALKNMKEGGFVSFGSSTTAHIPEKKPSEGGFVSFGSSTTAHIRKISDNEIKRQALKRLEAAAQGLPVTLDELAAFFASDLQSFGSGEVKQSGIALAVRWYAFTHMKRSVYWWNTDKPKNVVLLDEYRRSIR
jgi:hypothetical protein